jgi:hypothetical protein
MWSDPLPDNRGPELLEPGVVKNGDWVWMACSYLDTNEPLPTYRTQIGAGRAPQANPAEVAQDAVALLHLPTPRPQAWPPLDRQVVGLRTWLHVDGFEPQTATATAGDVSANVSVTPTKVVWHLGTDGPHDATATCDGPGAVWRDGQPDGATDCSYLFQRYSEGRTMSGSVEVVYHATWTSNVGAGGDLGELTARADLGVRVWEIQAQIN